MAATVAEALAASTFGQDWAIIRTEYANGAFMTRLVAKDGTLVDSCPKVHSFGEPCPHRAMLEELHDIHALSLAPIRKPRRVS